MTLVESSGTEERSELVAKLEALSARNEELRRMLVAAYRRLEELDRRERGLKGRIAYAYARARRGVRSRAPLLARFYRGLRVRLG